MPLRRAAQAGAGLVWNLPAKLMETETDRGPWTVAGRLRGLPERQQVVRSPFTSTQASGKFTPPTVDHGPRHRCFHHGCNAAPLRHLHGSDRVTH